MTTCGNLADGAAQPKCADDQSHSATKDKSLLTRLRAGDEAACEAFVRQHAGHMLAVARRFLRTEEDSADAVQDAFLSAFRSLNRFESKSLLGSWLHRIVVNVCLMKMRLQSPCRKVSIEDVLPTFDETGHHSRPVRCWEDKILARLSQAETSAQVRACIDRLPDSYREVLLLRDLEELDTEQVAEQLGIHPGAVKTRLHRARQSLRALLEPILFVDEKR